MENTGKTCKSVRTSMEDVYVVFVLLYSQKCRVTKINACDRRYIARCLAAKGVYPYDTRDADGSERFHPFQPGVTLMYNSSKVCTNPVIRRSDTACWFR